VGGIKNPAFSPCRDDKRIVNKVYDLIRENHEKKKHYFNLVAFMTFVTLYLTTLYLQLNTFQTFLVTSSFNSLLPLVSGRRSQPLVLTSGSRFRKPFTTVCVQDIFGTAIF
jgi:hypothetical protein